MYNIIVGEAFRLALFLIIKIKKTTSGDVAKRYSSMNTKLLCITEDLSLEYILIIKIILRK